MSSADCTAALVVVSLVSAVPAALTARGIAVNIPDTINTDNIADITLFDFLIDIPPKINFCNYPYCAKLNICLHLTI